MGAKPYKPHHSRRNQPSASERKTSKGAANVDSGEFERHFKKAQANGEIDLAEMEFQNRFRYGVKKPANVWRHEMDDSRITGDQIRTTNFKGTIFDVEKKLSETFGK